MRTEGFGRSVKSRLIAGALVVGVGGQMLVTHMPPAAAVTTHTVAMKDDFFKPKTITIAKGTAIKWVNRGTRAHTTTSTKGLWDKTLLPGQSFTRTFKRIGTFRYVCRFHEGMTGKIVVT